MRTLQPYFTQQQLAVLLGGQATRTIMGKIEAGAFGPRASAEQASLSTLTASGSPPAPNASAPRSSTSIPESPSSTPDPP